MIRHETSDDHAAIRAVVGAAFGQSDEAQLVDELRAAGDLVTTLVAVEAAEIRGHIALSALRAPAAGVALAPLSVAPGWRRRGIGSGLVRAAIDDATRLGYSIMLVVGDPLYYGRFGFSRAAAKHIRSRYSGPHFLALRLRDCDVAFEAIYPRAFDVL